MRKPVSSLPWTLAAIMLLVASVMVMAGHAGEDIVALPPTMKAVSFSRYGDSRTLQYSAVPLPMPGAGEVLLRVRAASVNPADWKRRQGAYGTGVPPTPIIPGFDVSGTVVAMGPGAGGFKIGDDVFGIVALGRSGGYAEYAIAPTTQLAIKPPALDHVHAAAVPLAALTAWQALFDAADLRAGQTILVQGGAGGVGHFAVQLARAKGAHVIATGSAQNLQFLHALGADQVIDYQTQRFEQVLKDVDVVFDTVGGDTLRRSFGIIRQGGYLAEIVDAVAPEELAAHGIRGSHIVIKPDAGELIKIGRLIAAGEIHPYVSRTFTLDQAARAQNLSEAGHVKGKIVLSVP